jgi:hypothetical protein
MEFLEPGDFCNAAEYRQALARKVVTAELHVNDLYNSYYKLSKGRNFAAKTPARIMNIFQGSGLIKIEFMVLDDNLEDLINLSCNASPNGINNASFPFRDHATGKFQTTTSGFFVDYFDDQFGPALAEAKELTIVG